MAKVCDCCGKKPQVGNNVSHAITDQASFSPNLVKVRAELPSGEVTTLTVCTRCLRSGAGDQADRQERLAFRAKDVSFMDDPPRRVVLFLSAFAAPPRPARKILPPPA